MGTGEVAVTEIRIGPRLNHRDRRLGGTPTLEHSCQRDRGLHAVIKGDNGELIAPRKHVNAIKDCLAGVADWIPLHGARAIQNKADTNGWAWALARDRWCHHRDLDEARAVRFSAGEEAIPLDFEQGACGTGLLAGHTDPPTTPHLGPLA